MRVVLVSIYPEQTFACYLLSSYILKAYLDKIENANVDVLVLNFASKTPPDIIANAVGQLEPDLTGYSCYVWNIETVEQVIELLKERTRCLSVLGGPEISESRIPYFAERELGDFYITGEGEAKLAALVCYLGKEKEDNGCSPPQGIAYRSGRSATYMPDIQRVDLSRIPSVYLSGAIEDGLYERKQAFIETQRGCVNRCKYCVYHKGLPNVSYFPLERVYEELEHLISVKQVYALRIFDSIFTSDLVRAKKILLFLLDLKARSKVRLPWTYIEYTYSSVDEEYLELTSKLKYGTRVLNTCATPALDRPQQYSELLKGYTIINCVGIQTFSRAALKAVGRAGISWKKLGWFMSMARAYNIVLKIDFILGLPFETLESYFNGFERFLPYLSETDHILNIHLLQMLPGSSLENLAEQYGLSYSKSAPHTVYSTNSMSTADMLHSSEITAIMYRIINSPLRHDLYSTKDRTGKRFYDIFKSILDTVKQVGYMGDRRVDDVYWNDQIFRDVPSEALREYLRKI